MKKSHVAIIMLSSLGLQCSLKRAEGQVINIKSGQLTNETVLIVINGESNAGGQVPNSGATQSELAPRPAFQILNNTNLTFEDLHIGVNNNIGHQGLQNGLTHGFELELANRADTNAFYAKPCYLVKTGQGGSVIDQWRVGQPYFTTFLKRVGSAKKLLKGKPYRTVIIFSLGINDAIASTDIKFWKASVKKHFVNMRKALGPDTPIIMTKIMPVFKVYNQAIEQIAKEVPNVYVVNTADATQADPYHWDYNGMKLIGSRMFTIVESMKK